MTKSYFLKLYQYNAWANRKVVSCLVNQNVTDQKILSIFNHLVSAQFIWYNRFSGLPKSEYLLWGNYSLEQLRAMIEKANTLWIEFIETADNFERELKYTNYVNDYYENSIGDIMAHLVNHGTYHRGQVAVLLREKGYDPVNTDFITYDRVLRGQLKD
jgi:uncharacterized damage-inducible protein DinB